MRHGELSCRKRLKHILCMHSNAAVMLLFCAQLTFIGQYLPSKQVSLVSSFLAYATAVCAVTSLVEGL